MMKFVPSSLTVIKDDKLEISKVRFEGKEEEREDAMDQLLVRADSSDTIKKF